MSKDDAPKKLTGLQMPLDISPDLAKIIASKKGEQVEKGINRIVVSCNAS